MAAFFTSWLTVEARDDPRRSKVVNDLTLAVSGSYWATLLFAPMFANEKLLTDPVWIVFEWLELEWRPPTCTSTMFGSIRPSEGAIEIAWPPKCAVLIPLL